MAFELPSLPFSHEALAARGMCQETLELHHGKHHQTYVNTLNGLVDANSDLQGKSVEEIVALAKNGNNLVPVFNNAGQHWNHSFFWNSLSPKGGVIPGKLEAKIVEDFGSVDAFKDSFKAASVGQFGSGWAWLVLKGGKLEIRKTPNAETPLTEAGVTPLLTMDVWEHAYYLDYQNSRPNYMDTFLTSLVNWDFVNQNLADAGA